MPSVWVCELCGQRGLGVKGVPASHVCDEDKIAQYQIGEFDSAFKSFLSTSNGRFETYYAKRRIRQGLLQGDDVTPGEATANP